MGGCRRNARQRNFTHWDLDRLHGGVHTLPPYEQAKGTDWYKGTANAIYQNIGFIDSYDPEYFSGMMPLCAAYKL